VGVCRRTGERRAVKVRVSVFAEEEEEEEEEEGRRALLATGRMVV